MKYFFWTIIVIVISSCSSNSCPPVGYVYYQDQYHQDSTTITILKDTTKVFFEQDKFRNLSNKAVVYYNVSENDTVLKIYFIGKTSAGSRYYRPEKYIRSIDDTVEIGINHQTSLLQTTCTLPTDYYNVDTLLIYKPLNKVILFKES